MTLIAASKKYHFFEAQSSNWVKSTVMPEIVMV